MADKVKRNQFTLLLGKEYVCQGFKLLKLGCELKVISLPDIKFSQYLADTLIMTLRMSGLRKNIKILVLA